MRAFNVQRIKYPSSKSHKLTDSTFPILKLFLCHPRRARAATKIRNFFHYMRWIYLWATQKTNVKLEIQCLFIFFLDSFVLKKFLQFHFELNFLLLKREDNQRNKHSWQNKSFFILFMCYFLFSSFYFCTIFYFPYFIFVLFFIFNNYFH